MQSTELAEIREQIERLMHSLCKLRWLQPAPSGKEAQAAGGKLNRGTGLRNTMT